MRCALAPKNSAWLFLGWMALLSVTTPQLVWGQAGSSADSSGSRDSRSQPKKQNKEEEKERTKIEELPTHFNERQLELLELLQDKTFYKLYGYDLSELSDETKEKLRDIVFFIWKGIYTPDRLLSDSLTNRLITYLGQKDMAIQHAMEIVRSIGEVTCAETRTVQAIETALTIVRKTLNNTRVSEEDSDKFLQDVDKLLRDAKLDESALKARQAERERLELEKQKQLEKEKEKEKKEKERRNKSGSNEEEDYYRGGRR